MSFLSHSALRCPLDQSPLEQRDTSLSCTKGHSFDIARQGYVNLLGAQDKRSRDPGDSKDMITARHSFLDQGHYRPIADQLNTMVDPLLSEHSLVVDAGCGEGYYLKQLAEYITAAGKPTPSMLGFDISKWAVQVAARRFPATWLVASNRQIPLADHSADLVLSLFGFPEYSVFRRIIKGGGTLLMVSVGPNHLLELRKIIYQDIRHRVSDRIATAGAEGFSLAQREVCSFTTEALDQDSIGQLLTMTPHLFRASSAGKSKVASLAELTLTVDVVFEVLSAE